MTPPSFPRHDPAVTTVTSSILKHATATIIPIANNISTITADNNKNIDAAINNNNTNTSATITFINPSVTHTSARVSNSNENIATTATSIFNNRHAINKTITSTSNNNNNNNGINNAVPFNSTTTTATNITNNIADITQTASNNNNTDNSYTTKTTATTVNSVANTTTTTNNHENNSNNNNNTADTLTTTTTTAHPLSLPPPPPLLPPHQPHSSCCASGRDHNPPSPNQLRNNYHHHHHNHSHHHHFCPWLLILLCVLFHPHPSLSYHFLLPSFNEPSGQPTPAPPETCPPPTRNVTMGILLPTTGLFQVGRKELKRVVDYVVNRTQSDCLLPGYRLLYVMADSACDEGQALGRFMSMKDKGIQALVGPFCEEACSHMWPVQEVWAIPSVTFGCRIQTLIHENEGNFDLKNSVNHRVSVHALDSFTHLAHFVLAVIRHFRWFRGYLGVVTEASSSTVNMAGDWLPLAKLLSGQEDIVGLDISVSLDDITEFRNTMEAYIKKSFVFVLCVYPRTAFQLLSLIKKFKLFQKGFVYIVFDYSDVCKYHDVECEAVVDFTGLLDISRDVNYNNTIYEQFMRDIIDEEDNRNASKDCQYKHFERGLEASRIYEAMNVVLKGFSLVQRKTGRIDFVKSQLNVLLKNTSMEGYFEENGDTVRKPSFMLNNIVKHCYLPIGRYNPLAQAASEQSYQVINDTVVFPGGTTEKPMCPTRFCDTDRGITSVLFFYFVVIICEFVVLIALCFLRRTKIRDMGRKDWIISSEALYSVDRRSSNARMDGMDENLIMEQSQDSIRAVAQGQIFTKVTVLEQQIVAIKSIIKESLVLTNEVITEVDQIRNLRHTNVNNLVAACVEPGNLCLVWGYGRKGSLRDVLNNDTFRLDWMFKISFISDIAKGMAYIHSSHVAVHGRLKSHNIIVDRNWTCKITDFPMPHFRKGEIVADRCLAYNLLWTAPEILRLYEYPMRATKKGDIYSFAIIMHEILSRGQPFGINDEVTSSEVLMHVINEEKPPYRPELPTAEPDISLGKMSDYGEVLDLMIMCWDEYPLFRLPFTTVSHNLKKIRQSAGTARNLADEMLAQMSKHADHLEEQVEERTLQIQDEQEKADELLARMLPKSVTRELKMGNTVVPEHYQSVTIFFSDIVGFTALASKSTPMQVVNMLNDLYTIFDTVVDDYDAYKIETIGDAYMVVSGLPVRNGDRHAAEIASVALRILIWVLGFRIRHCPDTNLLLRIGLHTGPVVAGVVGIKMPRYCLFGDTVQFASKMESSGKPLHIHISGECKTYLDKVGGFQTLERGTMDSGMGVISTYFLVGQVGLTVVVPYLPPDVMSKIGISISRIEKDAVRWAEVMIGDESGKRGYLWAKPAKDSLPTTPAAQTHQRGIKMEFKSAGNMILSRSYSSSKI